MIVRIHRNQDGRLIAAVCDDELINKKFEEGIKQLDLTSDFYKGEEKTDKETADLIRNSYMLNVVGEKATKLALDEQIIEKGNIKKIANIPYANVVVSES